MIEATEANLGAAGIEENPETLIADAGYCSEENVNDATDAGVDVLMATGRIKARRTGAGHTERPDPERCHGEGERWHAGCGPRPGGPITPDAAQDIGL